MPQSSLPPAKAGPGRHVVAGKVEGLAVRLSQISAATQEAAAALGSMSATITKMNAIAAIVAEHGVVAAAIARSAEQTICQAAQTPSGTLADGRTTLPAQDFGAHARMVNEAFTLFGQGVRAARS